MLNGKTQEYRTFLVCRLDDKVRVIHIEMLTELIVDSYRFRGYTTAAWQIGLSWWRAVTGKPKIPKNMGGGRKDYLVYFLTDRISEVEFQSHFTTNA
jgi:hypothetical protein